MAGRSKDSKPARRRPAETVEGRENQLVSLAIDLAEEQLRNRSASAQVITHYLKLGSTREQLEQERLRNENEVLRAKVEQMASAKSVEQLYEQALNAMRSYSGHEIDEYQDEYDEYDS